jgi:hypothetical protein
VLRPSGSGADTQSRLGLSTCDRVLEGLATVDISRRSGSQSEPELFASDFHWMLVLRQEIKVELSAGADVDNSRKVTSDIVGVTAEALGKGEGQF